MTRRSILIAFAALAPAAAGADPAAWQLTGASGNSVVLLGSVHYLRDRDYPLPASIDRLYRQADRLVMELDLDDIDASVLQTEFLSAAMLPPGDRLSEVMDARVYRQAVEQGRSLGIDVALLDRFEPWLVAITMLDLGMGRLGFKADRGLEQYLLSMAAGDGKDVSGLETLATQVGVFDGLGFSEQQALLEQTLNELDSASEAMGTMVDAWRDGRLEVLATSLMSEFEAFPSLYDALVVERNNAWIDELERLLADDDDYLVVVGALHLVGEDSVIELLRARGHRVSAVESNRR